MEKEVNKSKKSNISKGNSTKTAAKAKTSSKKISASKASSSKKAPTASTTKTKKSNVVEVEKTAKKAVAPKSLENDVKETIVKNTSASVDYKKEEPKKKFNLKFWQKSNKNEDKKLEKMNNDLGDGSELTNLLRIVLIVTGIFLAFYLVTYLVAKNTSSSSDDTSSEDSSTVSIQYDEILLSNLLKQNKTDYYVLAYNPDDDYYNTYTTLLTTYKSKTDALRVYTADLTSGFNSSYYDKNASSSDTKVSSISDLKINKTTLFKISNGSITDTYEGKDAIIDYLNSLD